MPTWREWTGRCRARGRPARCSPVDRPSLDLRASIAPCGPSCQVHHAYRACHDYRYAQTADTRRPRRVQQHHDGTLIPTLHRGRGPDARSSQDPHARRDSSAHQPCPRRPARRRAARAAGAAARHDRLGGARRPHGGRPLPRPAGAGSGPPRSAAGTACPAPTPRCWRVASSSTTAALDALSPRACPAGIESPPNLGEARVTVTRAAVPTTTNTGATAVAPAMYRGER